MLSTCSEATYQARENRARKEQNVKGEREGRKITEFLLSLRIEQLQKQLKEEKKKKKKGWDLQEK